MTKSSKPSYVLEPPHDKVCSFLPLLCCDSFGSARMKAHFENIQMIADVTTLPHALRRLSSRIAEEIHVSSVMETLSKGKGTLVPSEKLHLWNELKILSPYYTFSCCTYYLLVLLFYVCCVLLSRFH